MLYPIEYDLCTPLTDRERTIIGTIPHDQFGRDTDGNLITNVHGSNPGGDSICVANARVLTDMADNNPGMFVYYGYYGAVYLGIYRDILEDTELTSDDDVSNYADICYGFDAYPVLDEDEWSQVEQEWLDEALEPYDLSDLTVDQHQTLNDRMFDDGIWEPATGYLDEEAFSTLLAEIRAN